jgi:hypothetical protein
MDKLMDKLGDLPATLFSPAKMVYISYILLTYFKFLKDQPWWVFYVMSVLFLAVEIIHNDWGRLRLNFAAEEHRPEWARSAQR